MMSLYHEKQVTSQCGGCIPGLMQILYFLLFSCFFPSAFDLRQKVFADDLSAYDSILILDFIYHFMVIILVCSRFTGVYQYFSTWENDNRTTSCISANKRRILDMAKMMRVYDLFSALIMIIFFNNYSSGLSLYYFTI